MPRKAKRDLQLESPTFDYYMIPTPFDKDQFYIKRIRKISEPLIEHGPWWNRTYENRNENWLTRYREYNGQFIGMFFATDWSLERDEKKSYLYHWDSRDRKDYNSAKVCEAIIKGTIEQDISNAEEERKRIEAEATYEDRLVTDTRKVPPYKVLKI